MFGRKKTTGEKISAAVRAEFAKTIESLERDRREYLRRLKLKEKTLGAFQNAEAEVQRLHSERIEVKKRFWEAHYEEDEDAIPQIEARCKSLERASQRAEKTLDKARSNFEKADFDEVAESFALRTKANLVEKEANHRIEALEETLKELLAGVRLRVEEVGGALRGEYKEPQFETAEERDAHKQRLVDILNEVTKSYKPGK